MAPEGKEAGFLSGYRVLDLADQNGVFCGKLLGDLGAEVIKVEPQGGDKMRRRGPFYNNEVHPEKSLYFLYYNNSKRSITLNLEHADGRAIFKRLIKTADALVESFPVGYLASLGLDYLVLREINPRLVMASITPFGQTGPHKDYKASDLILMGMSGSMQLVGDPDGPPLRYGNEQSHYAPSQYAAVAVMAALYYREAASGKGQYIDISMQEALMTFHQETRAAVMWLSTGKNVPRLGLTYSIKPGGLYPCKDGWIGIFCVTPQEWNALRQWMYEVTGNAEILDSKYNGSMAERRKREYLIKYGDIIDGLFIDFIGRLTVQELFIEGQKRGICVQSMNTVADLLADVHLRERGFWVELDHPAVGRMKYPRGAWHCEDMPPPQKAAPLLGEANVDIYSGELGYSQKELAVLRNAGII